MLDHSFDRASMASSQESSRPVFVDMANRQDVQNVFNQKRTSTDSNSNRQDGYLSMDYPYGDSHSENHHGRHGHHHNRHQQDTTKDKNDGSDAGNGDSTNSKIEVEQLLQRILDLLKSILDKENAAAETSSPSEPAAGIDNSGAATAPAPENNGASNGQPAESQGSDNTQTPSTTSESGSTSSPSDTHTTPSTVSGDAVPGSVDAVWAQNDRNQATTYAEGDDASSNHLNSTHTDVPTKVPDSANGVSAWGIVMGENGANVDRNSSAQFKDMQTYVHLKTGGWVKVEDENDTSNNSRIEGMTENTNFTDAKQMNVDHADGVGSLAAPPAPGTMDHFGVANATWTPGMFAPGSIDGVYITANAKANENNSGLVAKLGADWWANAGTSNATIPGIPGTNNFTKLTDQWQPMYFTNLDKTTLENDPPPGITSDYAPTKSNGTSDATPNPTTSDTNTNSSKGDTKLVIPFPSSDSQWQQIINTAPKGSLTFPIYSGDNSKPDDFSSFGSGLSQHIAEATQAGLKPIGYIGVNSGTKSLDQVKSEIDAWYANAPSLQGIYLGGAGKSDASGYATDPASEAYYNSIADYIHSKGGMAVINGVYGNGGTPNPDYVGKFDVQGSYEYYLSNLAKEDIKDSWQRNYSADNFMAFVSGVDESQLKSTVDRLKANNRGYIWVSNTDYGADPDYWNAELQLLK